VFTGLIADLGLIEELHRDESGATLVLHTVLAGEIGEGDSVAVNGVCLTATQISAGGFTAQAINETLRRSSLGFLSARDTVNLELALRADGRLGGHIVQGHVDGIATVTEIREDGASRVITLRLAPRLARYLVEKGSVALDGVSLTVSSIEEHGFSVSLIPETLTRTNLGRVAVGQRVNIEVDILAKHVERLMEART
jgi:riboflavin synthase